jgi:fused signal recognition particle receptor
MFKFLKDKLKGAISKFSKKAEEEVKVEEQKIKDFPTSKSKDFEEPIKEKKVLEEEKKIIEEEKKLEKEQPKEVPVEKLSSESEEGLETPEAFQKEVQEAVKKEEEIKLEKERIEKEKELEEIEQQKLLNESEKGLEKSKTFQKQEETEYKVEEQEPEKKGFFEKLKEKIVTTKLSYDKFENLFSELELILMENNVALEVIEKIKSDLGKNLVEKPVKRTKIEETIKDSLKNSVEDLFNIDKIKLLEKIKYKEKKPFVIAFFGINGSGKTTTIAKIADLLKKNKISSVLAASDTFRAASIEQLQIHADKLGVRLIKHDYGSDPAAVAFDAVKHAEAKNIDVVLIDTAGRLHNQANLMEELKKIVKVAKPDLKLFVGESIAGNDCIEQAQKFNEIVGIDGIILTKSDVDEKGGAAISVSYVTKKPIMYLGVGQEYSDLKEFEPELVVEGLGL